MDSNTAYTCGGWSMHQPVDWDYGELLTDIFAPLPALSPIPQQEQQQQQQQQSQPQPQQQQTAMAPSHSVFHGMWASPMHQPIDWEIPTLWAAPSAPAASQPLLAATAAHPLQPQPALVVTATLPQQHHQQQIAAASSVRAGTCTAWQPQKEMGANGGGAGVSGVSGAGTTGTTGTKRDRGSIRRVKPTLLRPQQQQMIDLQKKLDALMAEHAAVEAENERLKTRLRVLEAVLPVRQQRVRWAQSKEAAERAAERLAAPPDPLLANLLDLAASGPSSCATSPSRLEGAAGTPAAAGGGGAMCPCGDCDATGATTTGAAAGGCYPADDSNVAAAAGCGTADNMLACSPVLATAPLEPAPCASSSCGATTTTTTTSGNQNANPPATHNRHDNWLNGLTRSCSHNTTTAHGCGRNHHNHHNSYHSHSHYGNLNNSHGRRQQARGASGCSRECGADSRGGGQAQWLDAWRAWVREAALLLQAHDARPNDHYLTRLENAFIKLKSEVVFLGLSHPELICNMRCVNLETGAEQEFPPDSFWSLVVGGMKLDGQQVANCKSALSLYRERMAVVLTERRSLAEQMSSCLTALQLEEADGRAAPGSLRREQLTLATEEAAVALDANVVQEGHTTSLARDLLGSNLFSRLQVARASVLSYPYFPDALAIVTAAVGDQPLPESPPPTQQQQQQLQTYSSDGAKFQPPQLQLQLQLQV